MGIAAAVGTIVGAQAGAVGHVAAGVPIAVALVLLLVVLPGGAKPIALSALVGCGVGIAVGWWRAPQSPIHYFGSESLIVRAKVVGDPAMRQAGWRVSVAWDDAAGNHRESTAFLPPVPLIGRGDVVELAADVRGRDAEELHVSALRVVARAGPIERARRDVRTYVASVMASHVPGSAGSLALGLLIGDDSALSTSERESMRLAGLSHITAVSGWNVTLVIGLVGVLFSSLRLRGWSWTAALFVAIAFFVWVVGTDPPVVRAALMAVVALLALRLGRPSHALTALSLSAATMTLVTPTVLGSLSFQLSALATFGMVLAARWTAGWGGWRVWLGTPVVTSAAIGLLTTPLIALRYGVVTPAAVPANVVAAPLVAAATYGGVCVALAGWVPPVGVIAGETTWAASSALLTTADWFSRLPFGHLSLSQPSPAFVAACYVAIGAVAGAITPEGRALRRRLTHWAISEPGAAAAACLSSTAVLIASLAVI